jgi:uncharacterized BrkB/YihY/UPF0761 family membrane protein
MKKSKLPIFIPLIIMTIFSAKIFFGKGIESGMENWRFYAALVGFLISCIFLFLFYKHVIKDRKKNQNIN